MKIVQFRIGFILSLAFISTFALAQPPKGSDGRDPGGRGNFDISKLPAIGILTGTVYDSITMRPLQYATIKVTHAMADTIINGGVTNAKGKFYIDQIKMGPQKVEVDFIGYNTKELKRIRIGRNETTVDLGKVLLVPSSFNLNSIEVTAQRSFMTNSIDRKTYDPKQLISSETGSAVEILENIPSIEVDIDGNLSLRGSQSVRILIDGRPSRFTGEDLADFLDQLPGNSVDKIEVITNPSAKYEPDGMSGIINIVLKKNALKGINGSLNLGYGGKDRISGGVNLNYRIKKVNLFANYSNRRGTYSGFSSSLRELYTLDGTQVLEQEGISERGRTGQFLKLGVDYYLNPKTTLTFQSTLNDRGGPRDQVIESKLYDVDQSLIDWYTRDTEGPSSGQGINVETILSKKLKKPEQEFNLTLGYELSDQDRNNFYRQTQFDEQGNPILTPPPLNTRNTSLGDRNEFELKADYSHPINKKSKFELGFGSRVRSSNSDFTAFEYDYTEEKFVTDSLLSNEFLFDEQIHALYGTYNNKFKDFGFQIGLRLEQVFTNSEQITTADNFENNYFNVYPSVHLSQSLNNDQELQLSYTRRVDRPGQRQLNPFIDYSDPLNLRRGNPFLDPEYINSLEFSYNNYFGDQSISTSIYLKNINNSITRIKLVDGNGISRTTYENLLSGNSYGWEFAYSAQIVKRVNLNASFNIFQTKIDGSNLTAELNNDSWGYSAKFTASSKLWKDATLQFNGRYRGKRVIAQGEISPFYGIGAAFRQSFFDRKLNISVSTRDLLNSMKFDFETYGPTFYQTSTRQRSTRIFFVSVSYRFGELQRQRRNNRRGDGNESFDGDDGIEID